jgi:flagella synthesis protein FlgN
LNQQAIAAAILAEYKTFQEFHRILQEEQSALVGGNVERLLQLVPLKNELLDQLTSFSNARNRSLSASGHENNSSGVEAWLNAGGADGKTREAWRELINLAREAEQLNHANGILIETSLRHNQQALSVLQAAANPGTSLYGRNGQISGLASGRPIDKV